MLVMRGKLFGNYDVYFKTQKQYRRDRREFKVDTNYYAMFVVRNEGVRRSRDVMFRDALTTKRGNRLRTRRVS
jgi:hypothetical protein